MLLTLTWLSLGMCVSDSYLTDWTEFCCRKHTLCCVSLVQDALRQIHWLLQAARETYSRAGYVRWTPGKSNCMVPWATDVDTSAELMYKQLYLGSPR